MVMQVEATKTSETPSGGVTLITTAYDSGIKKATLRAHFDKKSALALVNAILQQLSEE